VQVSTEVFFKNLQAELVEARKTSTNKKLPKKNQQFQLLRLLKKTLSWHRTFLLTEGNPVL